MNSTESFSEDYTVTDFTTAADQSYPVFHIPQDGWWSSVVLGLCCIVGVVGHGLVIGSVLLHRHMRTATNVFLVNLSLVDVLHVLTFPFLVTEQMMGTWPFGSVACKIYFLLIGVKFFTGMLTLCVVYGRTCTRLWFVTSSCCSVRSAMFTVLAIWVGSYTLILPITVFATTVVGHGPIKMGLIQTEWCTVHWPQHKRMSLFFDTPEGGFLAYMFMIGFIIPLSILAAVLCLVACRVSRGHAPTANQRFTSSERDALILSIIVFVFVLLWTPQWTLLMYIIPRPYLALNDSDWPMYSLRLLTLVAHTQSTLNPVIIFISDFRFLQSISTLYQKQDELITTSGPEINRNNNQNGIPPPEGMNPMYFRDIDTKVDWLALREKAKYGSNLAPVIVARGHHSLEIIAKPAMNPRFSTEW